MSLGKHKSTCFLICPIGEDGSETRERADVLFEELADALGPLGFEITRGDHHLQESRIDVDVVRSVQEADLCIADLSERNVNVYYEVGHRHETGKPIILIKRRDTEALPTDIATNRYTEYELETRRGASEFREAMKQAAEPYLNNGFESTNAATLSEVVAVLQRLERKVDALTKNGSIGATPVPPVPGGQLGGEYDGLSNRQAWRLARKKGDVPTMESLLGRLRYEVQEVEFYDIFVEITALNGSDLAAQMLMEHAQAFFDNPETTPKMRVEYLGSLVSIFNRANSEEDNLELVESLASQVIPVAEASDPVSAAQAHNQLSRLYHGIYCNTNDVAWCDKAIDALKMALQYSQENYLYYNLADNYHSLGRLDEAKEVINRCLALDEEPEVDHLLLACRIYRDLSDPDYDLMLGRLREVNPYLVELI